MSHFDAFEEISEGQTVISEDFLVTVQNIQEFASEFDPQPMHLDVKASKTGPFKKLIASGWQTLCLTMRLMVDAKPLGDHPLIGVGVKSIQFKNPLFPDTRIKAISRVISKRNSSKAGRCFVELEVRTVDAITEEEFISQIWTVMLLKDSIGESGN